MPELTRDEEIREALRSARTIAVLGAHEEAGRAAFYVPDYLVDQGYRVLPVNPFLAGQELWGKRVARSVLDLSGTEIDILDVFRRSQALPGHLGEILAMKPRPRLVWFQLGIRNPEVAAALVEAGLDVVQDRCTLAEHRRLGLGHVGE